MESRVNYTAVGVFVLVLGALSVVVAFWLTEGTTRKAYDTYLVYARDSVSGLNQNASVRFRGVEVGRVSRIELDRDNPLQVRLYLEIEQGVPITADTRARLQMQGITGLLIVDLSAVGPDTTPLRPPPGEAYPVIPYEPTLFSKLDDGISGVLVTLNRIGERFEQLFSEENVAILGQIVQHVGDLSAALAEHRTDITRFIEASRKTAENAVTLSEQGQIVMIEGQKLLRDGQRAVSAIADVGERIMITLDKVEGAADGVREAGLAASEFLATGSATLERTRTETLPDFERLLDQMQLLSRELTSLVVEIRDNPSRLITGGPRYAPGPGE